MELEIGQGSNPNLFSRKQWDIFDQEGEAQKKTSGYIEPSWLSAVNAGEEDDQQTLVVRRPRNAELNHAKEAGLSADYRQR